MTNPWLAAFARLFVSLIIFVFLLGVLWLGTTGRHGFSEDFFQLIFLCRIPLLAIAFLCFLPFLGTVYPRLIGGVISLRTGQMAFASMATILVIVSIAKTVKTIFEYGHFRFGIDDHSQIWLCRALGEITLRPSAAWWQLLPAVPLILTLVARDPDSRLRNGWRLLLRALVAVAAAVTTLFLVSALWHPVSRCVAGFVGWIGPASQFLVTHLKPGYFDRTSQALLPGHLQNLTFLLVTLLVYGAGYWVLHPKRSNRWFGWIRDLVPPLFYVLMMLTLAVWLLTAFTFLLDHWWISSFVVIGLFSYLVYRWILYDHFFTTIPVEKSDDRAKKKASAIDKEYQQYDRELRVETNFKAMAPGKQAGDDSGDRSHLPRGMGYPKDEQCLVVFSAFGGGILASAWTARVLTGMFANFERLELSTALISSVSGGSVGAMFVVDQMLLDDQHAELTAKELEQVNVAARTSCLEATAWGIAYPAFLRLVVPAAIWNPRYDHGWASEHGWMRNMHNPGLTLRQAAAGYRDGRCPQVIMNAVGVENGRRFLFSSGMDQASSSNANETTSRRFDFIGTYPHLDVPLVTAARMSATFPFVSPIARVDDAPEEVRDHFADGGYFDNFGVFSALEWIAEQCESNTSKPVEEKITRVLLVRIGSAMPKPESDRPDQGSLNSLFRSMQNKIETRVGWLYAFAGPLVTLLSVRGASQAERIERELEPFRWWCKQKYGVDFFDVRIEYTGTGPLSWELKEHEKRAIDTAWDTNYQAVIDAVVAWQLEDPANDLSAVDKPDEFDPEFLRSRGLDETCRHHLEIMKLARLFPVRKRILPT